MNLTHDQLDSVLKCQNVLYALELNLQLAVEYDHDMDLPRMLDMVTEARKRLQLAMFVAPPRACDRIPRRAEDDLKPLYEEESNGE